MTSLGFENYAEALKIYLTKYREVSTIREAWALLAKHARTKAKVLVRVEQDRLI